MSGYSSVLFPEVVKHDLYVDPAAKEHIVNPAVTVLLEGSFNTPFTKTSMAHGRSMEDPKTVVLSNTPLTDEFGAVYTRFSIKGASAALPYAQYSDIEPSNVRINGMLDASTFPRCKGISKILRGDGVLTEWPIYHGRPKWFPGGDGELPQEQDRLSLRKFKSQLYGNYILTQSELRSKKEKLTKFDSVSTAYEVGEGINTMKFGVMYRGMLSNVRLGELEVLHESKQLDKHTKEAIQALQLRRPTHFAAWERLEALDPFSAKDRQIYIKEILPEIMGENLARFHNSGSYHKYLHGNNWTLAGEIVDLDSVRNANFDSEDAAEITVQSRINELFHVIAQLSHLEFLPDTDKKHIHALFNQAYFKTRGSHPSTPEVDSVILEAYLNFVESATVSPQPPRITSLAPEDFNRIVAGAILAEINEPDSENATGKYITTFVEGISAAIIGQVEDYMLANGVDLSINWIKGKTILNLEAIKHFHAREEEADKQRTLARVAMANFL